MNDGWTDFIGIDLATKRRGPFAKQNGVYQIKVVKPTGSPISIRRLLGNDKMGIIYIGRGRCETVATRIRKNVENEKGYAGVKRKFLKLQPHCLFARARFVSVKTAKNLEDLETNLLKKYKEKFGELPPFNSKLG